jgi:hypothetical protein
LDSLIRSRKEKNQLTEALQRNIDTIRQLSTQNKCQ